jgi:hypothetical protein
MDRESLRLGPTELGAMFADQQWSQAFPPVLSVDAAARLADVPIKTIYDWSSRGLLDNCACKKGKRLRILRDRFIRFLFDQ